MFVWNKCRRLKWEGQNEMRVEVVSLGTVESCLRCSANQPSNYGLISHIFESKLFSVERAICSIEGERLVGVSSLFPKELRNS